MISITNDEWNEWASKYQPTDTVHDTLHHTVSGVVDGLTYTFILEG